MDTLIRVLRACARAPAHTTCVRAHSCEVFYPGSMCPMSTRQNRCAFDSLPWVPSFGLGARANIPWVPWDPGVSSPRGRPRRACFISLAFAIRWFPDVRGVLGACRAIHPCRRDARDGMRSRRRSEPVAGGRCIDTCTADAAGPTADAGLGAPADDAATGPIGGMVTGGMTRSLLRDGAPRGSDASGDGSGDRGLRGDGGVAVQCASLHPAASPTARPRAICLTLSTTQSDEHAGALHQYVR